MVELEGVVTKIRSLRCAANEHNAGYLPAPAPVEPPGQKPSNFSTGLLITVPPKKIISLISPLADLILGKALFLFLFFAFAFLLWVQNTN